MAEKTYAWKDPGGLTTAYVIALGILVVAHLGSGGLQLAFGAAAQLPAGDAPLSGLQLMTALFDSLQLALFIAASIAIFWALRMSRNAHTFVQRMEYSPASAVYWYLVPIASLFKPFGVMEELFAASGERQVPILRVWWTLFLVGNIAGSITFRLGIAVLDGLAGLVQAGSAAVFILISLRLKSLQRLAHDTAVFSDEGPAEAVLSFA
jgi:hypothetical protein